MMISKHSKKITISFIIVLGLSLSMIVFDLSRMNIMQSKLDIITNEHNVKSALMIEIQNGVYERQVMLRNILLMKDPFERDQGKSDFNHYAVNIITTRNEFSEMSLNQKEKDLLAVINKNMFQAYHAQLKLINSSIYNAEKEITQEEINKGFKTQQNFMQNINKMIQLQNNATKKAVIDAAISYDEVKSSIYILGGSALLFSTFIALFIIRLTESQARNVNNAISGIEESRTLLEERVYQRTKELSKARDEALNSNKTKDAFLATMSHELRTPLNIILGYSELLLEVAEDDNYKNIIDDLNKIQRAANHQLELINTVLDISKIEEGKLKISAVDFDVEKLLMELDSAVKPLMSEKDNSFTINCKPGIGMMFSDNMRIRQILLNILSNAAKFTEQGSVSLTVTKNLDTDEIKFEIQDSGVGIEDEYMKDLFKKFTQADSSTSRKYGGSGLGLSISKQLSNQLKGDVTVKSQKGQGSCFTLTLPIIYSE